MKNPEARTVSSEGMVTSRASRRTAAFLLVVLFLVSGNPSSLAPGLGGFQSIIVMSIISIVCAAFMSGNVTRSMSAPVWIFLAFLLFNSTISIARNQTLNTLLVYTLLAVALFALIRQLRTQDVVACLVYVGVGALLMSLMLLVIAPGKALDAGMLSGIYSHKNILGFILAIAFTANLYGSISIRPRIRWVIGTFLFAGVVFTDSTTAMLACFFSVAIGFYLHFHSRTQGRVGRGILTLAMLIFTGLALETILNESGTILSLLGKSPTLSARTGIWEFVTYLWLQRPVTGYGFGAVWSDESQMRLFIQASLRNPAATHAHNGYLDVLLQTGILGAVFFSILLLSGLLNSWKLISRSDKLADRLPFALLGLMFFYNVAESRFYNPAGWAVIVILSICANTIRTRSRLGQKLRSEKR